MKRVPKRATEMSGKINSIIAIAFICGCASIFLAQEAVAQTNTLNIRQYRPSGSAFPNVKWPVFDYSEVQNAKLIAEASEKFDYLPIDNLIIGNTRGYQVIGPDGEIFYVDDLESPTCGVQIVAQQIASDDGTIINQFGVGVSSVYIGEVNFQDCN